MAAELSEESSGERSILRGIRSKAKGGRGVRIGIGDDCAVLIPRTGREILVTTDFSIEGRHFHLKTHAPEAIGHKCLARGLSDIASMGGKPMAAFLSLAVPRGLTRPQKRMRPDVLSRKGSKSEEKSASTRSWMDRFYAGLLGLAEQHHLTLAGGDLSESPIAVADIIVIGEAPKGRALLRSTARPGDILYVTGTLGGAAAELATLTSGSRHKAPRNNPDHPHFFPQPRLATGQALLLRNLATACIDISDGLSVDLLHLCEESGVSAELDAALLPIHAQATLEQALHGGDDYELLFTSSPSANVPKRLGGVTIRPIGHIRADRKAPRITLVREEEGKLFRRPLTSGGWQHF